MLLVDIIHCHWFLLGIAGLTTTYEEILKKLVLTLVLLVTISGIGCLVETKPRNPLEQDSWRRTSQGWERNIDWDLNPHQPMASAIHPGLVASFQLLACAAGMLAAWPDDDANSWPT